MSKNFEGNINIDSTKYIEVLESSFEEITSILDYTIRKLLN